MDVRHDRIETFTVLSNTRLLSRDARTETVRTTGAPLDDLSTRRVGNPTPLGLAILLGITAAEILRQGAFYPQDALVVAVLSSGAIAFELSTGIDRHTKRVVQAIGLCAGWWLYAAFAHGHGKAFLPLGASMLGFLAGFLVVRRLDDSQRIRAATAIATMGAGAAAIGLYASVVRRFPLAMPAQNLWRLSTTLTYADAAGLLVGIALLVAVGLDQQRWLARVDVYLCTAALVATQSRGAVLAIAIGAFFVPMMNARAALRPVIAGVVGGLIVVATSSGPEHHPIAGVAVLIGLVVATAVRPSTRVRRVKVSRRAIATPAVAIVGAAIVAGIALRTPIQRRVELSSTNDRVVEWTAAVKQWQSSPITGTGPDKILRFHSRNGTFARFVHNEYLQVAAGSGAVGLALLLLGVGAVAVALRRDDALSSCACGALVAFAAAGLFDFDWHLSALGLVAGCVAGLAARPARIAPRYEPSAAPAVTAAAAPPPTVVCTPADEQAEEPVPERVYTRMSHWHLYVAMPAAQGNVQVKDG